MSDPQLARERPDLSALRMERQPETPRRARRWPYVVAGVVLLLALAALATALLRPDVLARPVEITQVEQRGGVSAQTVLTATGYTYARTRAAVGAKIIGRVVELRVEEGDRVSAGTVIAVLDSADLEAGVRQAEAALAEAEARRVDAEREVGRQQRLVAADVAPQAELDAVVTRRDVAVAQVGTAAARLDSLRAQLAYTVIRSPVDGVVIERNVEVGEMVAPGGFTSQQSTGAIVRIADPASLEVEADINEAYIARLELGQPASIRVDAVPDREYRGRLRQIVPTADRQRAVVEVKVSIDNRDDRLVPDMSCNVTFLEEAVGESTVANARLWVAASAVLEADGERYLLAVRDGRVERRRVEAGAVEGEQVEVLRGASAGDVVVRSASAELADGARVRVIE